MSVKFKSELELKDAVSFLETIISNLQSGKVVVQHGEDFVTFEPSDSIKFEMSAETKKGKGKMNISMSYKNIENVLDGSDMKISETEPIIEMEPESTELAINLSGGTDLVESKPKKKSGRKKAKKEEIYT